MKITHQIHFDNPLKIEGVHELHRLLAQMNLKLDHIMATEADLATQLATALDSLKTEIANTAQRVIDALNALPTTGDVSPQLQAAIDGITADVASLQAIAAKPTPTP